MSLTAYMQDYVTVTASAVSTAQSVSLGRYRLGGGSNTTGPLNGYLGDAYFYNSATENTDAVVNQLLLDYNLPEPSAVLLLALGSVLVWRRGTR